MEKTRRNSLIKGYGGIDKYFRQGTGGRLQTDETERDMHPVTIRKCTETDIVRAGAFYDRVVEWLDRNVNYPRWIYRVYPSEAYVRNMTETRAQYICLREEQIIGAFCLGADPDEGYRHIRWSRELTDGTYLIVHALAVDPAFFGCGLGSRILRYCIRTAQSEGYLALRADIVPDNLPARRLFEKHGFIWAGDADLGLESAGIPLFSLYELNW